MKRMAKTPVKLGQLLMIQSVSIILRRAGAEVVRFSRQSPQDSCDFINKCHPKILRRVKSHCQLKMTAQAPIVTCITARPLFLFSTFFGPLLVSWWDEVGGGSHMKSCQSRS